MSELVIVKETKNTHEKVRDFQNRLYLTAKTSKKRRFHTMYVKIYRKDILEEAWKRVKTNGGAGGIDKVSIDDVKAYGEEKLLRFDEGVVAIPLLYSNEIVRCWKR